MHVRPWAVAVCKHAWLKATRVLESVDQDREPVQGLLTENALGKPDRRAVIPLPPCESPFDHFVRIKDTPQVAAMAGWARTSESL